jgi:hypothetical protein
LITCPWCGSSYAAFQPNCKNCGASLPVPPELAAEPSPAGLSAPPAPPRRVPRNYLARVLFSEGSFIVGFVFAILGVCFLPIGLPLWLSGIIAAVGIPFTIIGVTFLGIGAPLMAWRVRTARSAEEVLRTGTAAVGEILEVYENLAVRVNGRHPWAIIYRFEVQGEAYEGKVSSLIRPEASQEPGRPTYVLYVPADPRKNTIYPNPYGYRKA